MGGVCTKVEFIKYLAKKVWNRFRWYKKLRVCVFFIPINCIIYTKTFWSVLCLLYKLPIYKFNQSLDWEFRWILLMAKTDALLTQDKLLVYKLSYLLLPPLNRRSCRTKIPTGVPTKPGVHCLKLAMCQNGCPGIVVAITPTSNQGDVGSNPAQGIFLSIRIIQMSSGSCPYLAFYTNCLIGD